MNNDRIIFTLIFLFAFSSVHYSQSRFAASAQLDTLCLGILNSDECARIIEEHQLSLYPRQVRRIDLSTLQLNIATSDSIILRDGDNLDGDNSYHFRDYLHTIGFYLLYTQLGEGNIYLLLNSSNGQSFEIDNLPVISPDCDRIVTSSSSSIAGYNPDRIQIWRIRRDSILSMFCEAEFYLAATDAEWHDNNTIGFVMVVPAEEFGEYSREYKNIRLTRGKWKVE